jgi:hypothetical protein
MIETGLRGGDACTLPFNPVLTDSSGWPCLRFEAVKIRAEQLIPLSARAATAIAAQQDYVRERWPGGSPWLFPGIAGNDDGSKPYSHSAFTKQLAHWQRVIGLHDESGQPVTVTGHQFRHTLGTRLKGRGVASDATFRSSREHALPAAQRAALRCSRPAGRRGCGDLGLHGPPGSDATMMQLIPLRGPHHRCACWQRDAPGSSRLHRAHHRQAQRPPHGRHRSCEAPAGLPHHWSRHAPDLATSRSGCT